MKIYNTLTRTVEQFTPNEETSDSEGIIPFALGSTCLYFLRKIFKKRIV